jgi:hypothetical protein
MVSRSRISPIRITSGRLAHRAAQRARVGLRVEADLALVDDRLLVRVQELDRILDGDDVRGVLVAVVDHRGQRGRLARAGGAHHQQQAARNMTRSLRIVRHAELVELGHVGR